MSDTRLDPAEQHSIHDLLEADVRLDRIETTLEDALGWAAEAKLVFNQAGSVEGQINQLRLASNLPLFAFKTSTPVPASLRPLVAEPKPKLVAAPIPGMTVAKPGEVDMSVALQWAKAQRIVWNRTQPILEQINDARKGWGLTPFRIKAKNALPADYVPEPTFVDLEHPAEPKSKVWSGKMPESEAEVLDLAFNFNGLISGLVTPEVAGWLLTLNTGNRKLNRSGDGVKRFVRLLRTGHWLLTGEPVIVSSEGVINDGQHRLHAIVDAGIAAHLDIRFGIDRSAFVATNTGVRRSIGQVLSIAGKPYGPMQGSIARLVYFYDRGEINRASSALEGMEIIDIVDNEPMIGEVARLVNSLNKFRPIRTSPFGFVLAIAARTVPFEKIKEFAHLCQSGQGEEDSAARRLHVRLRDTRMSKLYLPQIDAAVLAALAWNNWYVGKPTKMLRVDDIHRTGPGFPRVIGSE